MQMFLEGAAIYYVILLGRSVLVSVPVLLCILLLRATLFKKTVFRKGMLYVLLIPVPFIGKLKFFYSGNIITKPFLYWQIFCIENIWFCYLYLGIAVFLGSVLLIKRRTLRRYVNTLECRKVNGSTVYVSDLEITPFVAGVLHPKIVMPEKMFSCFDDKELETILLHEQVHIRQGHLLWYALWDAAKVLLWMNPLLFISTRYFHSDLEDMCDKTVIRQSGKDGYYYGKVLLKSIRCLREDKTTYALNTTAFVRNSDFREMKRRMIRVSSYRPYRRNMLRGMAVVTAVMLCVFMVGIYQNSYKRCNEAKGVDVYNITDMEMIAQVEGDRQQEIVSFDDHYVYINTSALTAMVSLADYKGKELGIFFGSYYKIPGIGIGGELAYVNSADLTGAECKIPYEKNKDSLWIRLLKLI